MNKKILQWIKENELWNLEDYNIPYKIYSPRSYGTKEINVMNTRKDSLRDISKHEQTLINLLEPTKEKYIREFPIPIFDHELWLNLCKQFKADEDEITGKSILFLDFFLPNREGVVIETDGIQHSKNLIQYKTDIIRDQYLKEKYNINTFRFDKFLDSWENGLEWVLLSTPQVPKYKLKDWEKDLIVSWKDLYYLEIKTMRCLKSLSKKGIIEINKKDLYYKTSGIVKSTMDLDNFNKLFFSLYGLKIIIT